MLEIDTDSFSEAYWTENYNAKREKKPKVNPQDPVFDETDHSRIKAPSVVNIEPKRAKRNLAERLTAAFLASGGAITICKPGRYRKFRFGAPRPIAGMTGRRDNCLSGRQWDGKQAPHLSRGQQSDLIRQFRAGDKQAGDKLYRSFHKLVLSIVSVYYGPTVDELVAAATEGFSYALSRFDLKRNNSFDAYVGKCIRGHVLDYIKKWNRGGVTGTDTRANRALFSDPNLDAEELAKKAGISLKTAEKAIDCADLERVHYDTTESSRYDDDTGRSQSFQDGEVSAEFRAKYSCCDKYSLSPQLKILRRSEKTTWDDEKAFRQLRNAPQADLVKRAGIMARFDQYREPSADIRNAKTNREWQKQNWFLEPDFSDDHDYRPSKSEQGWLSMSDQAVKRLVVQLPKSLFSKVEEAASRDYTSVSDITRRALASDLRVRGLLAEDEGEVIA